MKLYGSKRANAWQCKYGCCGGKESKARRHSNMGMAARKAARSRARQQAKREVAAA